MKGFGPAQDAAVIGTPPLAEVRRVLDAKTRPLLIERIRIALYITLTCLTFFLLQDVIFFRERAAVLLPLKAAQLSVLAAVLLWLRLRPPDNLIAFALLLTAVFSFGATAAGIARGTANGTPLLLIVVTASTAIGFPWGAGAQAIFVVISGVLSIWNDYALSGSISPAAAGPGTGAMLTAGMVSVVVAQRVAKHRLEIEAREMGLRLREEYFRSLIENGGDLIAVIAEDGVVRYVSPSIRPILGHAAESWVGARVLDFVHGDDAAVLRQALAACAAGESVYDVEVRLRDADGEWRVLNGSIANLLGNAAVKGFVFNARDVTQRRQMEQALRNNQAELTHALRLGTIGEIASALAHEINQPLAAISNYASACARRLGAGTTRPSELQQGLTLIAGEALRAGRIVHGLRELSRKGDGGMEMIDVNAAVRRAAELMEPQARLEGVSLQLHTSNDLPSICADSIQIEQVVLNLLLNGIESMQATPVKILSASTVQRDGHIEVRVSDTGVGLDPDVADRVFEPFFTTKPTGLGMGLAISRRIIEAHGGAFQGTSNPDGRGSAFSFSLPLGS